MKAKNMRVLLSVLGVGNLFAQYGKNVERIIKIQGAMIYLRMLHALRSSYMNIFQIIFFFMFFFMGLIFLHAGAVLMLTAGVTRFSAGLLIVGIVETAAPVIFALWFTSAGRWLDQAAKDNPVLREYLKKRINED